MQTSKFIAERGSYGESEGDFSGWTAGCRFKAEVTFLGVDVPALLKLSVGIHVTSPDFRVLGYAHYVGGFLAYHVCAFVDVLLEVGHFPRGREYLVSGHDV